MGTQPESQEQGAEAKCGCSPRRRPRPSLLGDQALRGLPGENKAHSSISGLASAQTAAGPVLAAPPRAWAHPGCGGRRVGGHPVNAHLVSGAPCAPWSPRLPIGSRLTLERSEGQPRLSLLGGPEPPCQPCSRTAGCCPASPTVLPCLRPGRFPCDPVLAGTTLVLISEAQFPGARLWAQSVTRELEGDARKCIPGNPCG